MTYLLALLAVLLVVAGVARVMFGSWLDSLAVTLSVAVLWGLLVLL